VRGAIRDELEPLLELAGAPAIAFRAGGWDDRRLAGALAVYDGPADLLDRFEESPLARPAGS